MVALDKRTQRLSSFLEPLVQRLLQRDELPIVRRCAAEGLDYLQDRRATPALLRIVEQPQEDPEVRLFATRALIHLADPQAVEAFQRLLHDQQAPTRLRKAAADGVGALGDTTALPMLTEVLGHPLTCPAPSLVLLDPANTPALAGLS